MFEYLYFLWNAVGSIVLILVLCKISSSVIDHFKSKAINKSFWKGKRVVITGASSGIGEETAFQLAKCGAHILLTARRLDVLKKNETKCKELGAASVLSVACDVSVESDCVNVVEEIKRVWRGHLDVLVLNAGISSVKYFDEHNNLDDHRKLMNVNYWGCLHFTFHARELLEKSKGRICVVGSVAGHIGTPKRTGYSGSKFAVRGFYECFRREFRGRIGCTLFSPGFITTNIHANSIGGKEYGIVRNLSEFQTPQEASEALLFATEHNRSDHIIPLFRGISIQILKPLIPDWIIEIMVKKGGSAVKTEKHIREGRH